jgi:hypothetical protein
MFTLQVEAEVNLEPLKGAIQNRLSKGFSATKGSNLDHNVTRGGRDSARNSSSLTYNNSTVKSSKR